MVEIISPPSESEVAAELGLVLVPPKRLRLARTGSADDPVVDAVTAGIRTASRRQGDEPDPRQGVVAANVDLATVFDAARAVGRATRVAVVSVDAAPPEGAAVFELTPAGRVTSPTTGIDVAAAGLTAEEATLCAAIVDVTRVTPTTDVPNFAQAADGWRALADQAGGLRTEFTRVRLVDATGSTSLLPERTDDYVDVGATTEDDINDLAPRGSCKASQAHADLDPTLDDDVEAWFDDDSRLHSSRSSARLGVTTTGS